VFGSAANVVLNLPAALRQAILSSSDRLFHAWREPGRE
jgi:hypothetical protein